MDYMNLSRNSRSGTFRETQIIPAIPAPPMGAGNCGKRTKVNSEKDLKMKTTWLEIRLNLLRDWEQYPVEYEIFLSRIADGASVTDMLRMHSLTNKVFFPWIESDPKRHQQYKEAIATRERIKLEQKTIQKQETMLRKKAVKLYFQMHDASQDAWETACRLLGISPAPTAFARPMPSMRRYCARFCDASLMMP